MAKYDKEILRKNVLKLLQYSGITSEQFANIIGISLRKLQYLKKGNEEKATLTIKNIEAIATLFNQDFTKITTQNIEVFKNFRNELLSVHRGNVEYQKILEDRPSIPYAIESVLVHDTEFKNSKLEVKQILEIFRKHGWIYESSSVSNELKKAKDIIKIEAHPFKGGTNLYSKLS